MEVKKFIAVSAAVVSIAGVAILAQASTTTVATDSNRSWVYGTTGATGTNAESNLTDKVETHWSEVMDYVIPSISSVISEPAGVASNAHISGFGTDKCTYNTSVSGWGPMTK